MKALYRKYRPQTFDAIVGQSMIVHSLKNQVRDGNVSHAYLFSGTRGTGKTSAAKILSRAVNCLHPKEGNPCNECEHCLEILNNQSLDVVEMDAASNNGVEDIRDLKDKVIYPPSNLNYKVYIIDEVHMLSKGAFNALLKILEEPPSHLIFILATTELERIPTTIISRTQQFNFRRIGEEDLIKNMRYVLDQEEICYELPAVEIIASHSDGAMRDALSILDQCLSLEEKLTEESVRQILGLVSDTALVDLSEFILKRDSRSLLDLIQREYDMGKNMSLFLQEVLGHYRNLLLTASTGVPPSSLGVTERERVVSIARAMGLDEIFSSIDSLNEANSRIRFAEDPKLLVEVTLLKLMTEKSALKFDANKKLPQSEEESRPSVQVQVAPQVETPQISNEVTREKAPEKPLDNTEQEGEKSEESSKEQVGENLPQGVLNKENDRVIIDNDLNLINQLKDQWETILNDLRAEKVNTYALLREGFPVSFENKLITIGFEAGYDFHLQAMSTPQNLEALKHVLRAHFNDEVEVRLVKVEKNKDAVNELIEIFGKENIKFE